MTLCNVDNCQLKEDSWEFISELKTLEELTISKALLI